jgi:hypothetical protein
VFVHQNTVKNECEINIVYPSDKHSSLFSETVGHPTSIEESLANIEAYPTEIVVYTAKQGANSQMEP